MAGNSVLKRVVGKNLPEVLGGLAGRDAYSNIEELISNSYDCDAPTVRVMCDVKNDTIILEDDGEGMSRDRLDSFYGLGDSPKLLQPNRVTASGRHMIGKFGIGTIVLSKLCGSYTLTTMRDRTKYIITETFPDGVELSLDKEIPFTSEKAGKDEHGTKIVLSGLKLGKTSFTEEELKRRLRYDMPLRKPGFTLLFNGQSIRPAQFDRSIRWELDYKGEHLGPVTGTFLYCEHPVDEWGVYVYARGRRVGNPKGFDLSNLGGRQRKVVAFVDADGLDDAISFERSEFRSDHPGVRELEAYLREIAGEVGSLVREKESFVRFEGRYHQVHRVIRDVEGLAKKELADILGRKDFQLRVVTPEEIGSEKKKKGVMQVSQGVLYHATENVMSIDETHWAVTLPPTFSAELYALQLKMIIVDGIARFKTKKANLEEYLATREDILWKFTPGMEFTSLSSLERAIETARSKREMIQPQRVYDTRQLAEASGRSLATIRRLLESGALIGEETKIVGKAATSCMLRIEGYTSLHDVVAQAMKEQGRDSATTITYDAIAERFPDLLKSREISFVKDIAEDGRAHLYFVRDEFVKDVATGINNGHYKAANSVKSNPLKKLNDVFVTPQKASELLGVSIGDIELALNFAERLRSIAIDKQGEKYRYAQLVRAHRNRQKIETRGTA